MHHHDGYLRGDREVNHYYQYWLPEIELRAALVIIHGLAEHSGRYMNVVNFFVPLGYAVYSIDHIGHGKSDGERVFVERFQDYTATLKIFIDFIQDWQPEKPIFIVGHSMGGLISASFLLEHQDKISGAVLSGPAIKVPDTISKATILAGKALSILMPQIGVTKLDSESLCRDPAVVDALTMIL